MKTILNFMGGDHDRLDTIFKKFQRIKDKDKDQAVELFLEFRTGLERHIVWEEEVLFPLFENKTGMCDSGPTAVMRTEHKQIKDFLKKISSNLMKGDTQIDDLMGGLVEVLIEHNNKEEEILYPWIDSSVSEQEKKAAYIKMEGISPKK